MVDEYAFTIEADGEVDELAVPRDAVELLREEGETPPEVVGDLAILNLAQQLHGAVHHSQGEPAEEVRAAEAAAMDAFEERFGQSFAEMTGHDH